MGSLSKHHETNDRISNLPSNLIGYLLSFLPAKDAVKTSALSTHWNQQWTLITHLDFDDSSVTSIPLSQARFVNFVYRVLLIKVTPLELFRLKCSQDYVVKHIHAWLFAALSRNARQVDLMVSVQYGDDLETDCLFSSRTLVVLKLGKEIFLRVPMSISLESLKILHFESVDFEDSESLSRLVSSCPVLEEFKMNGRLSDRVNVINISSLVLKRLILSGLCFDDPFSDILTSYKVVLNTPSLEYLETNDFLPDGYDIKTLHCLKRASLCLNLTDDQSKLYKEDPTLVYPMEKLAVAISNVRFLHLSEYALETFHRPGLNLSEAQLPKFPRLMELKIDVNSSELQLCALMAFLESTPQLASLCFELTYMGGSWHPPISVPLCLRYNLTVIQVDFVGELEMKHLDIVKYFLNHTVCLKELIISGAVEQNANVIKEVLMFPRASKSCKIVLP